MIEFEEACELIFKNTNRLGTEERLIENSIGYVLAKDIVSPISVAPFRNSAMDGFAVKYKWLSGCSADNPASIEIGPTSFAGNAATASIVDGQALKVMTGARVPDDFDAVVPFEETDFDKIKVRFARPATPGQHIRESGEDIIQGQKLYREGAVLERFDVGILATIGLRSLLTYRKPSVMIIGTGDELADPGQELIGDQIYDANTYTILSMVAPFSRKVERIRRVPDRKQELLNALRSPHDVIVTTGGISVGEKDFVVDVAESCDWRRVFHKVRIKPGKPVYFAVRGKQVLFGLPGNTLSTAVTCSVFLIPALKKMSGWTDYRLSPKSAVLASGESRKTGRKLIWPGFKEEQPGRIVARFSPKKSSAALTALLGTDGLIIQDATEAEPGSDNVEFIPWNDILN